MEFNSKEQSRNLPLYIFGYLLLFILLSLMVFSEIANLLLGGIILLILSVYLLYPFFRNFSSQGHKPITLIFNDDYNSLTIRYWHHYSKVNELDVNYKNLKIIKKEYIGLSNGIRLAFGKIIEYRIFDNYKFICVIRYPDDYSSWPEEQLLKIRTKIKEVTTQ